MLQIIPVIDIKQGSLGTCQVVHAKHGQRDAYQLIQSQLSICSDVFSIVEGLLKLYPFQTIYIADIDAITNSGNHFEQIELLSGLYPQVNWWVDNGVHNINARILYAPQANIRAVLGSENIHTLQDYRAISYAYESRHVLSLDKLDNAELGTAELHNTGLYWPDDAICMTLNHVGSNAGPDLARLQQLTQLNLARKKPACLYAAGGVRNIEDCWQLKQMDISGVLVATALHNGSINTNDLQALQH